MTSIDIIVPTLGRAHRIEPLALNVANVSPLSAVRLLFIVDRADKPTRLAIAELAAKRYRNALDFEAIVEDGTYPHKINVGAAASSSEFVCCSGDDAVWHEGWLEAALAAFVDPDVHVVGTCDLTPSSADGTHSTQPIVRRAYIDAPGGALGEPGRVMHEGYHHNFCETELCQLAQHRGVYLSVPDSIIEHRHPDWGTAEHDATYAKGARRHWGRDSALFDQRRASWTSR